ncbi:hypothetical protein PV11_03492 [Exophiala sideris]|uniref:C2H2-type domain-containing protein n=1 Tax=Exophiala sideris TaxID=1016849 RepID=A0A0D1YEA9_9EURO|nr:hypothetical protein PV11_03492 [Exophiala sideris]
MLRYSTQDAFWNRESDAQAAKSASRIGRLRDPNRPRKLTEKQSRQVRQRPSVLQLLETRNRVRRLILQEFRELRMAVGEPIHDEYQELRRILNSTVRAEERALLKRIQQEYNDTAPIEAIQRQIKAVRDPRDTPNPERDPQQIKIPERRRMAEAAMSDPAVFVGHKALSRHIKCSLNIIALCRRRERRSVRPRCSGGQVPPESTVPSPQPSKPSANHETVGPLTCQKNQCLFCLFSDLPQEDREKQYARKHCLQRHAERCRLGQFRDGDLIPCPDILACRGMVFNGKEHFKNHAASIHRFIL